MRDSLLEKEIEALARSFKNLELESRAEIDRLRLELEALRLFIEWIHPNTSHMYQSIRDKVIQGMNPETVQIR